MEKVVWFAIGVYAKCVYDYENAETLMERFTLGKFKSLDELKGTKVEVKIVKPSKPAETA